MSSSDIALSVRNLSKCYTIRHNAAHHTTVAEALLGRLRHPLHRSEREEFWALHDVSLDVRWGEVMGIVGSNGAGKSTLLKLIARITAPSTGAIDLYGRVGSLLEVGTGFHPELTGRENIYLNGTILGMRRREIDQQFDAIVGFAGVEQFLDTPVKRYSSGMYVRLAFAVAAHLRNEILVVDEVLAVGDVDFQHKCLDKMKDMTCDGRAVLFVSHQINAILRLCNSAVLFDHGTAVHQGEVGSVLERYLQAASSPAVEASTPTLRPGSGEYRFTSVLPMVSRIDAGEEFEVRFSIERFSRSNSSFWLSCHVVDVNGFALAQCDSRMVGVRLSPCDRYDGSFILRSPWLKPGIYTLHFYLCADGIVDVFERACSLEVGPVLPYPYSAGSDATATGLVLADFNYLPAPTNRSEGV
jgi:lipopolysaccharide transport system ATP-binding protein